MDLKNMPTDAHTQIINRLVITGINHLYCLSTTSTVSSGLNSLAAVVAEDVVKPFFNPSETKYTWITKGLGTSYFCTYLNTGTIICITIGCRSRLL